MKFAIGVVAATAALLSLAPAEAADLSPEEFAAAAASADSFEVESSRLALSQSQNQAVRDFAQMMVDDHTTSSQELQAAATADGVTVPPEMSEEHAAKLQELSSTSAAEFDQAYVAAQESGHEEALSLMQDYADSGEAAGLKAHAQKAAPIIESHLEQVQALDEAM